MIFTNKGKMYRVLVDNIPVGTNVSVGTSVHALVEMEPGEEPSLIYSIVHGTDAKYVLFVTQNGVIKKTSLEEFTKTRKRTGLAAINLAEGDHIVSVSLLSEEDIVIMTRQGMGIKFKSTDVSPTGRTAGGVKGINLNPDDYVIAALPIRDANDSLGIFNVNGSGKKIKLSELVTQKRGGKGIKLTKTEVAGGALISDEDSVLIIGTNNSICISAKEVPLLSRASVGNALIKGDINSISKI
jgi:DNA gyrase subunit A